MNRVYDVIVVGGGVIGCSIAYHAARKGARVLVLEKDAVGGKTSGGSSGMLAAQDEAHEPGAFLDACLASRTLLKTLVPEVRDASGIDPQWETRGVWRVAENAADREKLLEKHRWQAGRGLRAEWLPAAQVSSALPFLGTPYEGALYFPDDGQISSRAWVDALAAAAVRRGVRFAERLSHVHLERDGRRITGVRCLTERYGAGHTVVAAGAWTSLFLSSLDVDLPLEPVKGQLLILRGRPPVFPAPVFVGRGYFTPKPDGRLLVGTTHERTGFDTRATLAGQRPLADWALRWCPSVTGRDVLGFWAGLRPTPPDNRPYMGPVPDWPGLSVCAGHFRNGVLLSAFSGRFMADGILDNAWDPAGRAFFPDRVAKKALWN